MRSRRRWNALIAGMTGVMLLSGVPGPAFAEEAGLMEESLTEESLTEETVSLDEGLEVTENQEMEELPAEETPEPEAVSEEESIPAESVPSDSAAEGMEDIIATDEEDALTSDDTELPDDIFEEPSAVTEEEMLVAAQEEDELSAAAYNQYVTVTFRVNESGCRFDPASLPAGWTINTAGTSVTARGYIGQTGFNWPEPSVVNNTDYDYSFLFWSLDRDGDTELYYDEDSGWFRYWEYDENTEEERDIPLAAGNVTIYANWEESEFSRDELDAAIWLNEGTTRISHYAGEEKLYRFTPAYDATYVIESTTSGDPDLTVYHNGFYWDDAYDEKADNGDFLLECEMEAGETYYLLVEPYSGALSGTITIRTGKHSHIWDSWEVVQPAAAGRTGRRIRYCRVACCEAEQTETIPALPMPVSKPASKPASKPVQQTVQEPAPVVEPITISQAPSLGKVKGAKGKATISWKKLKKSGKKKAVWNQIAGIQVQYSADPSFQTGVTTATVGKKKAKMSIKGLAKGTTYYVRIRYMDGAGGYSNWSAVKTMKTGKTKK